MSLGHGWLCQQANEAGKDNACDAWAWNYSYMRMDLLEKFDPDSEEYRKWFR